MNPGIFGGAQSSSSSAIGGGSAIGDMQAMPARSSLVVMGDGSKWLRSGYLAPAAIYPVAASLQHMRAHSFTNTATSLGSNGLSLVTNGTGTWVAVRTASSQVHYSTDNGQTWTAVAHGMAANPRKAVWTGTRFVLVGNDTTLIAIGTSSDGITWANNIAFNPGSGLTADTAVIGWNGSLVIVTCQGTANAYTSADGLGSWATQSSGHSGAPAIDANPFQVVIFNAAGSTSARRSADGITWQALTLPTANVAASWPMLLANRLVYLTTVSGVTGFRTTLDFSTFSAISIPPIAVTAAQTEQKFRSSGRIALTSSATGAGQLAFTSDGEFWEVQSLGELSNSYAYGEGNGQLVGMPTTTTVPFIYAQSSIDSCNAVGISAVVSAGGIVSATNATFYARIQ